MFITKKNIVIAIITASASIFWAGCQLAGNLATETESEKVVPAEFQMADTEGKIVVIVTQPAWIKTPVDLRATLTDAFNFAIEKKAGIKKDRLSPYADVLNARLALPEDKRDSAFDIAGKLSAKYVIIVQVLDFDLSTFAEKDFYNGSMQTKTCLFDVNESKLWPEKSDNLENAENAESKEGCRDMTVGIEAEKGTVKTAVERLSVATAHCVSRYFYNCKKPLFRIAEEQKKYDYYTW